MRNKIIYCTILLIILKTQANSNETIISYYEINGLFKILLHKTKIEYDKQKREKKEISYVRPWGVLKLGSISIYEYPEKNIKIEYYNSSETRAYKIIYKYDNNNLINVTKYISDKVEIPIKEWETKYRDYYYEKESENIYEYNDKNNLIIAKSLFGSLFTLPIENLPYKNSNIVNIKEFKYIYDEKGQKINVFGSKDKKTNEYLDEWKYFYNVDNRLIKKEIYVKNELSSYYTYKYNENNFLIEEIAHSIYFNYKENKNTDDIIYYYSYKYYPDGRIKRKNKHNHMDYKRIEEMKIYAYDEYIYK